MTFPYPHVWYSPTTEGGTATAEAPPTTTDERRFNQADIDAIVKDRLERQKRSVDAASKAQQEAAEAERLKAAQEWQKVAEQKEAALVAARAELAAERLSMARDRVAAKYHLPEALAKRLIGTTEDELDADAKDISSVIAPATPAATAATTPTPETAPSKARGYGPRAGVAAPATGEDSAMVVGQRAQPGNPAGPAATTLNGNPVGVERERLIATKKYSGLA